MGFEDASDLAHAIEDLLDAMRQDELTVTPERMDLIFAGVDMIEAIVREIESEGESTVETDDMVAELRAVLEESDFDAETGAVERSGDPKPDPTATDGQDAGGDDAALDGLDVSADDADGGVVRAQVSVGEGDMLGVDAMLALDRITNAFDLLDSDPDRDAIESGEFEGDFALALDAPDADAVAAELDATVGVVDPGQLSTKLTGDGPGRDPEEVADMFHWAAVEAPAEDLDGEVLDLRAWKKATR